MITPPLYLKCFEIQKRLEGGESKPFLVWAKNKNGDEYQVVLKLKKPDSSNHLGATSLACELICSIILRYLGLLTPDYAIVYIDESVANSVPRAEDRKLLLENKGKNFGTLFQKGATTWMPHKQTIFPPSQLYFAEDVLTFDATVINGDRNIDKPNILQVGEKKFLIDHSLALPVCKWSNEDISESKLFPSEYIKKHCCFRPLNSKIKDTQNLISFTKLLDNWKTGFSQENWQTIRGLIPSSWEESRGELDKIFYFLQNRPQKFADISNSLRSIV